MKVLTTLAFAIVVAANAAAAGIPSPLESAARQFLVSFNAGQFDAASRRFNDEMKKTVTTAMLAEMKQQADAELGAFRTVTSAHTMSSDEGFPMIELIVSYEKSPASLRVVFDAERKIAAVYLNAIIPPATDPVLEKTARDFLAAFNGGEFDAAARRFTPKLRRELPPSRLATLAQQVRAAFGAFQTVSKVQLTSGGDYRVIVLTAAYETAPLNVRVVFDGQSRIAGLTIEPVKKP